MRDPRANYKQSLEVLRHVKRIQPNMVTKSSLMLGLGEGDDEVLQAMKGNAPFLIAKWLGTRGSILVSLVHHIHAIFFLEDCATPAYKARVQLFVFCTNCFSYMYWSVLLGTFSYVRALWLRTCTLTFCPVQYLHLLLLYKPYTPVKASKPWHLSWDWQLWWRFPSTGKES